MSFIIPAKTTVKAVLILLHGYGTSANDFIDIGNYISRAFENIEVHILDGFYEIDNSPDCRMWFALDDIDHWKRDIQPAGAKLTAYIDNVLDKINMNNQCQLTKKNVILAGFSQGAMMALHVGLHENVGAVISFSGMLVDESVINKSLDVNILLIHGEDDDVVHIKSMEHAFQLLYRANIPCVKSIKLNMRHSINIDALKTAKDFIYDQLQKMQ